MTAVAMPRLSDSMEEGTILRWLVESGAVVARGQEIAEIETDKATMTFEADVDGPLTIVAAEGDTLPVGAVIAEIGAGSDAGGGAGPVDGPSSRTSASEVSVAEMPSGSGPERSEDPSTSPAEPTASGTLPSVPSTTAVAESGGVGASPAVSASPVARRVAADRGVELSSLRGSGPNGRIVRADVEAVASAPTTPRATEGTPEGRIVAQPVQVAGEAGGTKGAVEVVEPTRVQQLIARRMAESKATIPEFTVSTTVDAEEAFALRERLRGSVDPLPSINDLIVKAAAVALRAHPRANASWRDGAFELHGRVNVGIAVAAGEAGGAGSLVVPTIFDADAKSLTEIAAAARAAAQRVREGTITPPELSGGTFSVSNLGMYGVTSFQAVINPPQAAILAAGAAVPSAVSQPDGSLAVRRLMQLTLTADHRVLYGADAAAFVATIRDLLEQPLRMLVW